MSKKKIPENNELIKQGEEIVKKTRGSKSASIAHNTSAKADDIRRIGKSLMRWYEMEKAVTDDEIRERLLLFFTTTLEEGGIPTVEEMCLALGYPRSTVWRWEVGEEGSTPTRRNLIKRAKELLASFDAKMVTEGKINPVTYIFRAKNYFGLKDEQQYVLTPNNPLGDTSNPNDIQRRISESIDDE